ncbi:hypothetical protein LCGC14_2726780, partial [marine sediment metagenome]
MGYHQLIKKKEVLSNINLKINP